MAKLERVLLIGDIVGRPGRQVLTQHLSRLKEEWQVDLVIANAENASGGLGIDRKSADELMAAGVDLMTLGNHCWNRYNWLKDCEDYPNICHPLNAPANWPGYIYSVVDLGTSSLLLLSLQGQAFMDCFDNPFVIVDEALEELKQTFNCKLVFVDFHAEATAEKQAMGYFLMGRVTCLFGTHTHVQTADERILGDGTAYITDLGMTGPSEGVLGMDRERALRRFVDKLPAAYSLQETGATCLQGVLVDVDSLTGQARKIERVNLSWPERV